jgi:hypothetical protein
MVAKAISFDDSLGHEIMTYTHTNPGGHNSAFSPEDLCSNFIGTAVAGLAIGGGGPFPAKVDAKLASVLRDLKAQTPAETRKAFDRVNGRWVDFTGPASVLKFEYLKRRNFSRLPFKVGHPSDASTPSWALAGFGHAEDFYTYTHTLDRTIPKTSFAAEIRRICTDAAARYGTNFDKP